MRANAYSPSSGSRLPPGVPAHAREVGRDMKDAPNLDETLGVVHPVEDLESVGARAAVLVQEAVLPVELADGGPKRVLSDLAHLRVYVARHLVCGVGPAGHPDPVLNAGEVLVGKLGEPEPHSVADPGRRVPLRARWRLSCSSSDTYASFPVRSRFTM